MGQISKARLTDRQRFAEVKAILEGAHPGLHVTMVHVDGETQLRSEHGGMRIFWLYQGEGEVFLPKGYRTQEGDGERLPDFYQADPVNAHFAETLRLLKNGLASVAPGALVSVRAILRRWRESVYVGDMAGDLWTLAQTVRPWSSEPAVEAAISSLPSMQREQGYSTKQVDSYEPLLAGDQLCVCGEETVRVRGHFDCLALEKADRRTRHISTARRLRFLMDTSGGCNPDFAPFRRLPLTWYLNHPGEAGDGLNFVNCHVVNIPKETSPTHFHPPKATNGSIPQAEMYLVLNPKTYQLNTWGRQASLVVFPDLRDLSRSEQHPLEPGMFIYIPPGTGHRGLDAFVNVLTIPGFKLHNEFYIDRDVRDLGKGRSPFNENLLNAKNYDCIEELL